MPKIIVEATKSGGDAGRVTLSERVVASHLEDDHYAAQLIERLTWAAIDAERLESHANDEQQADLDHALRPTRPPGEPRAVGRRRRPAAGTRRGRR